MSTTGVESRPTRPIRLSLYFGNSPEFWMNLQTRYDLKVARRELPAADRKRIHAHRAA